MGSVKGYGFACPPMHPLSFSESLQLLFLIWKTGKLSSQTASLHKSCLNVGRCLILQALAPWSCFLLLVRWACFLFHLLFLPSAASSPQVLLATQAPASSSGLCLPASPGKFSWSLYLNNTSNFHALFIARAALESGS